VTTSVAYNNVVWLPTQSSREQRMGLLTASGMRAKDVVTVTASVVYSNVLATSFVMRAM
jgi:hypothetical protein